jgi:hypothetical protein
MLKIINTVYYIHTLCKTICFYVKNKYIYCCVFSMETFSTYSSIRSPSNLNPKPCQNRAKITAINNPRPKQNKRGKDESQIEPDRVTNWIEIESNELLQWRTTRRLRSFNPWRVASPEGCDAEAELGRGPKPRGGARAPQRHGAQVPTVGRDDDAERQTNDGGEA